MPASSASGAGVSTRPAFMERSQEQRWRQAGAASEGRPIRAESWAGAARPAPFLRSSRGATARPCAETARFRRQCWSAYGIGWARALRPGSGGAGGLGAGGRRWRGRDLPVASAGGHRRQHLVSAPGPSGGGGGGGRVVGNMGRRQRNSVETNAGGIAPDPAALVRPVRITPPSETAANPAITRTAATIARRDRAARSSGIGACSVWISMPGSPSAADSASICSDADAKRASGLRSQALRNQASNAAPERGVALRRRLEGLVQELGENVQDAAAVVALAGEQPVGDQPQRNTDRPPA